MVPAHQESLGFLDVVSMNLRSAMQHPDEPSEQFLTRSSIQGIWSWDRLAEMARQCRAFGMADISTIRSRYLHTLSILVFIGWNEWERFRLIFVDHPNRTDKDILGYDFKTLTDDTFLGNYGAFFLDCRHIFSPVSFLGGSFTPSASRMAGLGLDEYLLSRITSFDSTRMLYFELEPEIYTLEAEDYDIETIFSAYLGIEDYHNRYIRNFADRLAYDIKHIANPPTTSHAPTSFLNSLLKIFAWRLHGESMDLLQWEASVVLDQGRAEIIDLLVMESTKHSHEINCGNESVSAHGEGVESLGGQASGKLPQHLTEWISNLEPPSSSFEEHIGKYSDTGHDPMQDPPYHELPDHEKFIYASEAYRWLLAKIRQHQQIEQRDSCLVSDIGSMICSRLRAEQGLRTLSRRKASLVTMTFWLDWYPPPYLWSLGMTLSSSSNILEKVLCLTGTWNEAQLMTVAEYIRQTWPVTGEHMITFVQRLLVDLHEAADVLHRLPGPQSAEIRAKFQHSSEYQISVTGSPYLVSEIGEGIGWLISVLRVPPSTRSKGIATCSPRILDLDLRAESTENPEVVVVGTCQLVARFHDKITRPNSAPGFCWGPLFSRAVLVTGFPVLRRHEAETGLEMSIGIMSYLIRSRQVVQWGERIIMKGFSSLVIATVAASNTIVWHLLTSDSPTERISYIHPRLDTVDMKPSANVSLQSLEHSRHIVGWCPSAVEYCGHATALQSISASGLPSPPPSIIIDRLYLEGGAQVVGGFSMGINNKENPFWLERESDYPSLIKWISSQPIVFYDISDSRAWLVDGVSALLHLVRVSLHLDQTDPESPYEWVFDASALKDTWNGSSTGRLAALKTLTCWDNLKLPLYVKDNTNHARGSRRQSEKRYSTLGDRVKKIMHSIEILLDRQVKAASQDGIKISQTLSTQRSIVGFDILDVINPLGPIHARIKHMPSRSHGWIDLIQTLGVTTIFGKGFGDLIQPSAPDVICSRWKLVPTGMDYLAASVSTLNMLYDKRLLRLEPGLGLGEMTNKIIWVSTTGQPFEACECMSSAGRSANGHGPCKFHPVQYLVSKRPWKLNIIPRGSTPIDLASLERTGAVVFGHLSSLGRRKGSNSTDGIPQHLKANEPVLLSARATDTSQGSIGTSRSSTVGSGSDNVQSTVSTQSTGITAPSILSSGENKEVVQRDESKWRLKVRDRKVLKKWMKWVWS